MIIFVNRVERLSGNFGNITVGWMIEKHESNLTGEFSSYSGTVQFRSSMNLSSIRINVLKDGTPELDETFTVVLYQVEGNYLLFRQVRNDFFILHFNCNKTHLSNFTDSKINGTMSSPI